MQSVMGDIVADDIEVDPCWGTMSLPPPNWLLNRCPPNWPLGATFWPPGGVPGYPDPFYLGRWHECSAAPGECRHKEAPPWDEAAMRAKFPNSMAWKLLDAAAALDVSMLSNGSMGHSAEADALEERSRLALEERTRLAHERHMLIVSAVPVLSTFSDDIDISACFEGFPTGAFAVASLGPLPVKRWPSCLHSRSCCFCSRRSDRVAIVHLCRLCELASCTACVGMGAPAFEVGGHAPQWLCTVHATVVHALASASAPVLACPLRAPFFERGTLAGSRRSAAIKRLFAEHESPAPKLLHLGVDLH